MAETQDVHMFDGATVARVMTEMHMKRLIEIKWTAIASYVATASESRLQSTNNWLRTLTESLFEECKV